MDPTQRGSVLPLLAAALALAVLIAVGIGRIGQAAVARARARTAADAAALAGAAAGRAEAADIADANGGRLVGYEERGRDVRVTVRCSGAVAVARARTGGG
jgi:hypothetical protein